MNHPTPGKTLAPGKIAAISQRLYLLRLVMRQPEFRRQYGREMGQAFRDRCHEA
jgi:hypothetical protein